ncbi:MAG: HAD family phosphatase [Rhizomicrobium sp.]
MQTIIFDFFGVVVSEIAPFVLPRYMSAADVVRYRATLVQEADLGYITQKAFFDRLAGIAGVSAKQLEDEFWAHVKVDSDTVALIEALKTKYRVALLTNAIVPFVRQIMARHDLARLFDTIMVSSEEHMIKPDPAFFQHLLTRMDVQPEDAIFLDDNPVNIEGAKNAGIAGILFTTAPQAARELYERFSIAP